MDVTLPEQLHLIFILLIVFQLKHYIADFPLQREYMLGKTLPHWDFVLPLSLHCAVHAILTLLVCLVFAPSLWWLCFVDFVIHFIIDRIKSGPNYLGRFHDLSRSGFWNVLGLDQMAHHLTHIYFIYLIVIP